MVGGALLGGRRFGHCNKHLDSDKGEQIALAELQHNAAVICEVFRLPCLLMQTPRPPH